LNVPSWDLLKLKRQQTISTLSLVVRGRKQRKINNINILL
jgi:hypothetical protein